ncbi:expressed unknown protein [Seminavis robusta]|uniref:Uncharacterized protein n=1 Tax=Seminavis robusta TaxID=568900 RepID=A0A9N8DZY6_9STRA|nr:expressed unknown protein [Seminavis robusta]|eukprot:Sro513_g157750.1 n/a (351) ;mRNA; f:9623-10675
MTDNREAKNNRLKEIRKWYEESKRTPEQKRQATLRAGGELLATMRRNGASPEAVEMCESRLQGIYSLTADVPEPRDEIVSWTFYYQPPGGTGREVTITSETRRHWRTATTEDIGSIVFLLHNTPQEFGKLDGQNEEEDEMFEGEFHTVGIIHTQSGQQEAPGADDMGNLEGVLVVPEEVLNNVNNEAPPGKIFSGRTQTGEVWSPAPDGQVWMEHPRLKTPRGMLMSDELQCHTDFFIRRGSVGVDPERFWMERGSVAHWCPILQRFISEGERLRQQHWFHNGDGSAQQRYFYNQIEMLDRHGGLANLPMTIDDALDPDLVVTEVRSPDQAVGLKFDVAEKNGKVINVDE